jgi:hypothetical protein
LFTNYSKTCCLSRNRLSVTLNVAIANFKYVAYLFTNYSLKKKKQQLSSKTTPS